MPSVIKALECLLVQQVGQPQAVGPPDQSLPKEISSTYDILSWLASDVAPITES